MADGKANAMTGQWGWAVALVTFLVALLGIPSGRKDERPAENKPAVAASAPPTAGQSPREFLREYIHGSKAAPPLTTNRLKAGLDGGVVQWSWLPPVASKPPPLPSVPEVKVLIASVPDPIDTPFAFWYDQLIESFTKAAAEAGYVSAGYWSPWELFRAAGGGPTFERYPGLLLFRDSRQSTETSTNGLLIVFLVGETPNTLRSAALREALDLVAELEGKANGPMRLVAPYFSGNQFNLERALRAWNEGPKRDFGVISGSASSLNASTDPKLAVSTTIIPTHLQINAALRFLEDRCVIRDRDIAKIDNPPRVAFLVESNSGFGYDLSRDSTAKDRENATKDLKSTIKDLKIANKERALVLKYPMHLSRLQSQSAQQRLESERQLGANVRGRPSGPSKAQPRPNHDIAQGLDEFATPPLNDRAVDDLVALIRRDEVSYVGIIATDPEDTVFLVDRVKRSRPNVEVFIPGMDMTYLLPENRYVMRGVVVTSTYPMYPPNQLWTRRDRRQVFQSEVGEGCFNAAVFHLGAMRGWKNNLTDRHLAEYRTPLFTPDAVMPNRPPVWVLTVGEYGRLVTHGYYDGFSKSCNEKTCGVFPPLAADESEAKEQEPAMIRWPVLGPFHVIATITLVAAGIILFRSLRRPAPWPAWADWRMSRQEQSASVFEHMLLAGVVIALAMLGSIVRLLLRLPVFEANSFDEWCLRGTAAIGAAELFIAGFFIVFWLLPRFIAGRDRDGAWLIRLAIHAGLLFTAFGFLVWNWMGHWPDADVPARVMYLERSVGVLTGHSIILPVLFTCLGYVAYGHYGLRRNHVGLKFRLDPPFADAAGGLVKPLFKRINERAEELADMLTGLFDFTRRRAGTFFLTVAGAILVTTVSVVKSRTTFEHNSLDLLFGIGFWFLTTLVVLTIVRFVVGWLALKEITRSMALVPMVGAYDRLPRKAADLFGRYFVDRIPRAADLVIPRHLLAQLAVADDAPVRVRAAAAAGIGDVAADEEFPTKGIKSLNEAAKKLTKLVSVQWPNNSVADAFGGETATGADDKKKDTAKPDGLAPPWQRTTEDFLAIQAIIFLSQFFIQLRYLATSMVLASLALMLAVTSYPFQPEELLLYETAWLLVTVCGSFLWVLVSLNRDEIYSRITRSTPNRFDLNWSFVITTLQYVGPVLLIAFAQFSGRLRALLVPLLEQLR